MSPIRHGNFKFSTRATVFLALVFALFTPGASLAQYYEYGNPPVMGGDPSWSNVAPTNPASSNVPTFDPPVFDPYAGGNYESPVFQPPQFYTPPQGGTEPELLALGGGISNAYANPFGGMGPAGGAVPAFQPPGILESPANQRLAIRERERPADRRIADQRYIDACEEIRDSKNKDAWRTPLPPYAGPLANRTNDNPDILQSSYLNPVRQDDYEYDWEKTEKHYFDFSMLDPTRFGERVKVWVGLGPDEKKARKHFDDALQLMKNGQYGKAGGEFEWAAYYWQETAVEEDARYHAAECYYREKRFNDAVKQYTKLLTGFPNSQYKTEAIRNTYEIAKTWLKQATEDNVSYVNLTDKSRPTFDTFGYAENALKAVYINCPNDPMADSCVFLLAVGYMKRGRAQGDASYERAAEYFSHLRDSYPNSRHLVEAMQLEVICRQKAGLGADYDPRHVNEASKLADQVISHGQLSSEQKSEILQLRNQLTEEKAAKLWVTGQFWDRRKDYGAARLQYREIIDKYPATDHAEKARLRYDQIRDLPDELPSDAQRILNFLRLGRKS